MPTVEEIAALASKPGVKERAEQALAEQITIPAITPGGPSSLNQKGYDPSNIQYDTAYAQQWAQQFGGQPASQPPPPPAAAGQPPQATPAGPPELPQQPRDEQGRFTKLYAGKYASPEALETGYYNQAVETQKIIAERDALRAAQALMNQAQPFRTREERPNVTVAVPNDGREPYVNPDQLEAVIEARAAEAAQRQVAEILGPVLKGNAALNEVRASYPDYSTHEAEFTRWLTVNPEVAQKASRNPEVGMELAYLKFTRERRLTASEQVQHAAATTNPIVEQARQHAAPPAAGRATTNDDASRNQKLWQLYQYGLQSGDWKPYQEARISEAIPNWHFGSQWGK